MAYVALSHFLPNDRQKRRKKLQQCTFQDPNELVPCMSTFRGDENPQRFGWMLTGPSREHTKPTNECELKPLERDSENPVDIDDFPSNLRNYENTLAFPRFFEPIDFRDAIPFSVCYTYKIINLAVVLGPDDMKAGFSMVTTTEGCEVNHVSRVMFRQKHGAAYAWRDRDYALMRMNDNMGRSKVMVFKFWR